MHSKQVISYITNVLSGKYSEKHSSTFVSNENLKVDSWHEITIIKFIIIKKKIIIRIQW